jgi:hypothetical protein
MTRWVSRQTGERHYPILPRQLHLAKEIRKAETVSTAAFAALEIQKF